MQRRPQRLKFNGVSLNTTKSNKSHTTLSNEELDEITKQISLNTNTESLREIVKKVIASIIPSDRAELVSRPFEISLEQLNTVKTLEKNGYNLKEIKSILLGELDKLKTTAGGRRKKQRRKRKTKKNLRSKYS